jgi:acyl-coenzyme A thioesterase PaaI-like protein
MVQQPNSKHCFVCGLENPVGLKLRFHDDGVGEVRARISVPAQFNGYPGIVHGGIVAAMLDETGGRPIMIGHPNRFMVTANMTVRYRQPVPVETELLLVGRLLKDRGRIAQAHSELRLPDGTVAAEAELTLVALTAEYAERETDLDALGWQIYPDEAMPPSFD